MNHNNAGYTGLKYEREIKLSPLDADMMTDAACMALLSAIIKRAFLDYRRGVWVYKKRRYRRGRDRKRKNALAMMAETEAFLLHTDCLGLDEETAEKVAAAFKQYQSDL